jgi:peptidyl-prolyl cis-trans isomerase B (cyclophilin B)
MRVRLPALLALACACVVAAAGCGGGGDATGAGATAPFDTADTAADTSPVAGGGGTSACRDVEAPEPKPEGTRQAPTALLDEAGTYRAVVETSCGSFTITLDAKASPTTVASFVALADDGFYDGTVFHRIVPGFVIQGGDPTATGAGGPGYSTVDTPAPSTTYSRGTVAMAKTADEPPGTAGSQFFVVTAGDAGLPPDYAVIGTVTDGLDVVARIGGLGDPGTELPTQPVVVESIRVQRS